MHGAHAKAIQEGSQALHDANLKAIREENKAATARASTNLIEKNKLLKKIYAATMVERLENLSVADVAAFLQTTFPVLSRPSVPHASYPSRQ